MSLRVRPSLAALSLALVASLCLSASAARQDEDSAQPVYRDYKGVSIGMTIAEARQKLGTPSDKSDMLDLYEIGDKQTVQVFYTAGKVSAVAVAYMKPDAATPTAKAVLGTDIESKPDGSMHRMVRYPKAGYWVSYSRTGGSDPIVTVTMQKL